LSLNRIETLDAPELEVFTGLNEVQLLRYYEPEIGVFVAESANVVLRALEAGYEPISILVEDRRMEREGAPVLNKIEELFGKEFLENFPVYTAGHEVVEKLTGYALVRGLWAVLRRKKLPEIKDFCAGKKRLVVLYDIMNPTNVGAIIRSAAALGADGAVLTYASVNPLTRRAARVSMGTVFQIPWTKEEVIPEVNIIELLHGLGFKTVAMALTDDSVGIENEELKEADKLAIVMGSEGYGLPKEIISGCTYRVKIPMYHGVDSLNVAAASAVAFWEIFK